jgi:hypothetical protein
MELTIRFIFNNVWILKFHFSPFLNKCALQFGFVVDVIGIGSPFHLFYLDVSENIKFATKQK